ncbi:MAG TPA: hypothetical protein VIR30_19735 [Nocardioides sp.]
MQQFASLRVLALAVLPMPVLLGLVLWFVLKSADGSTTAHLPSILLVAVVAVLAFALILAIGYRSTPFRQGVPLRVAVERGARVFQSTAFMRMALSELPMLVGLALAFVAGEGGLLTYAVGAAATLLLLLLHFLPNATQVRKVQESLERQGARVPLLDAFQGQPVA